MPFLATIAGWFGISIFRLLAYAAVVLAIVIAVASFVKHERDIGRDAERQRIEQANEKEMGQADAGQKDVDACERSGRTWDRASGVCGTP